MKKKRKKWIILGAAVILVVVAVALTFGKKGKIIPSVQASALKQTALSNTVSTTGVVQSTDNVNVYTTLNYSIKTVAVKVGDRVKAGDVLCQLDTQDLTDTITQKEDALRLNAATAAQKIKISEKKYSDSKSNLDAGFNTQINTAQNQVDSAKRDLDTALQNQVTAKAKIEKDFNTSLITANANVDTASVNLSRAQSKYDDAKKRKKDGDYDNEDTIDAEIKSDREALNDAQRAHDNAQKNLSATKASSDQELAQYQTTVNTAQANYNSAVKSLNAAQAAVNQDLQNTQQSIASDKLSADDTVQRAELASLRTKLAKCTVTAPTSGTVTAVYAVQNATANGLLFVIENTDALKISVQVKEYDVGNLKEGMRVIVKSDSTGDDQYEGTLQRISPTAEKSNDGKTVSSSDVEFDADVVVSSKNTRLKIGMNARAEIIVEKKDSVFAVPYDAVTTDAQGKDIVYIAKKQSNGTYQAEALAVTTGIETDAEVEISGDGLKDGLQIISDSKQITSGETVTLGGAVSSKASSASTATPGAMRAEVMG